MRLVLSPGQASDKTSAPAVIEGLAPGRTLIADRADDAGRSSNWWRAAAAKPKFRPARTGQSRQRVVDAALYRKRNLVERFFNKLKHFRRIATRYDKTARNFLAAVALAATRLWLRFESTT